MGETSLEHVGVKGMRWGVRNDDSSGWATAPGSPASRSSAPKASTGSAGRSGGSKAATARPKASASRTFRDSSGVAGKRPSEMSPEQRAHRKKMIIGGVAVVGVLGIVAVGVTANKASPGALRSFEKLSEGSKSNVAKVLAHPNVASLKLRGGQKVNSVKLNALFKQAEIAERGSKSPLGIIAKQRSAQLKANPTVARAGINQSLGELRRDTAQAKSLNDAEKYLESLVSKRSESRFAREAANISKTRSDFKGRKEISKIKEAKRAEAFTKNLAQANANMQRGRRLATPSQAVGGQFNRSKKPK